MSEFPGNKPDSAEDLSSMESRLTSIASGSLQEYFHTATPEMIRQSFDKLTPDVQAWLSKRFGDEKTAREKFQKLNVPERVRLGMHVSADQLIRDKAFKVFQVDGEPIVLPESGQPQPEAKAPDFGKDFSSIAPDIRTILTWRFGDEVAATEYFARLPKDAQVALSEAQTHADLLASDVLRNLKDAYGNPVFIEQGMSNFEDKTPVPTETATEILPVAEADSAVEPISRLRATLSGMRDLGAKLGRILGRTGASGSFSAQAALVVESPATTAAATVTPATEAQPMPAKESLNLEPWQGPGESSSPKSSRSASESGMMYEPLVQVKQESGMMYEPLAPEKQESGIIYEPRVSRFEGLRRRIKEQVSKLGRIDARELLNNIKNNPELLQSLAISGAITLATLTTGPLSIAGVGVGGALSIGLREWLGRRKVAETGEQAQAFNKIFDRLTSNKHSNGLSEYDSIFGDGRSADNEFGVDLPPQDDPVEQGKWRKRLGRVLGRGAEIAMIVEKSATLVATRMHVTAKNAETWLRKDESGNLDILSKLSWGAEGSLLPVNAETANALPWNEIWRSILEAKNALNGLRKLDLINNNIPDTILDRLGVGGGSFDRTKVNRDTLRHAMKEFILLASSPEGIGRLENLQDVAEAGGKTGVAQEISALLAELQKIESPEDYTASKRDLAKRFRRRTMLAQMGSSLLKSAFVGSVSAAVRGDAPGLSGEYSRPRVSGAEDIAQQPGVEAAEVPEPQVRVQPEATPGPENRSIPGAEGTPDGSNAPGFTPEATPETTPDLNNTNEVPLERTGEDLADAGETISQIPGIEFSEGLSAWDNLLNLAKGLDLRPNTEMGVVNLVKNILPLNEGSFNEAAFNTLRDSGVVPTLSEITMNLDTLSSRPGFNALLQQNPDLRAFWLVGRGGINNNQSYLDTVQNLVSNPATAQALLDKAETLVNA